MLAHVPDLNDFVAGLAALVGDSGVISIEVPHLLELVKHLEFDTIYHEHFSYFSLLALSECFARHGLGVRRRAAAHTAAAAVCELAGERCARCLSAHRETRRPPRPPDGFLALAERSVACRDGLVAFLTELQSTGRSIVAYGAAAKGNTLLNFASVHTDLIPYVVDRNPHKQGLLLPGSHLPIRDPAALVDDRPDYVLILPWNLSDEITEQMSVVKSWGGRFVVAVPAVREVA